jgi:transposase
MLPPKLFPPMTTVQHYFMRGVTAACFKSMNHSLLMAVRTAIGREALPSAGVIDSQSVKASCH